MRWFSIRPALTLSGRTFKGVRGWAGKPTHPPLTDFPIVCYVLAAACDVVSIVAGDDSEPGRYFFVTATILAVAGLGVSVLTAITGFWDWWKGMERDRSSGIIGRAKHTQVWRTANWHMSIMVTVTLIVVVEVLIRLTDLDAAATSGLLVVLSVLAGVLVAFGAAYGGALVFDYQFNVEPLKGSTVWDETEEDQLPGQRKLPPA